MFALLKRRERERTPCGIKKKKRCLKPWRCPMPVPILCLDNELRHFAERFREQFSKPQYQYFVTVLLGLMLCEGRRTLSAVVREVGSSPSLSGLSRFLAEAPWS